MKSLLLLMLFCLSVTVASAQPFNKEVSDNGSNPKLLGKINKEGLSQNSYASWFIKNYDKYPSNTALINQFKSELASYTVELFLGTWCGDSKREVPRFYKILEDAEFPMERLTVVAVDRKKIAYKQSPGGEHEGKNIHRVPTFIFYKNGVEINRITEHPVNTLEEDIRQILHLNYTPNYMGVTILNGALEEMGLDKFRKKKKKLLSKIKEVITNMYELNTYSHKLYYSDKKEEAIAVGRLNLELYPEEAYVYKSLANRLAEMGVAEKAKSLYEKARQLDPEDATIQVALNKLKGTNLN